MPRLCLNCKQAFEAVRDNALYCSGRCRAEASRRRRQAEVERGISEIEAAAQKIRRVVGRQDMAEDLD